MGRHRWEVDPTADRAAPAVLAAYVAAKQAYQAGIEAWRRLHPDGRLEYASRQAVTVILEA